MNTLCLYSILYVILANLFTNISSLIFLPFLLGSEFQGIISIRLVTDLMWLGDVKRIWEIQKI